MTKRFSTAVVPCFAAILIALTAGSFCLTDLRAADGDEETPLEKEMTAMNKSYRLLKKQIADSSKKDSSVELVKSMKKNAVASKEFAPLKAKDVPEADKAKFSSAYQASMDGLIAHFDKIEKALSDGKADEAKTLFDELTALKRKGHEEFQKDADPDEK